MGLSSVFAIIQATYQSNVFPGKSMVKFSGKTVMEHIVTRIRLIKEVSEIILSTSDQSMDNPLVEEAQRLGVLVFRGSEHDVISRLCEASRLFYAKVILKINGNYPLFDPQLASKLISEHIKGGFDYSYNEHFKGVLFGTGCEVINKDVLLRINKLKLTAEQRESGSLYIRQNERNFNVYQFIYGNPRPHYKLCFDTSKDLKLIDFILNHLQQPYTKEIINLLDNNLVLAESNRYESVKEVGLEKLYLFPEKIAAFKKNNFKQADMSYPISIELSLTNRCNYNCIWCSDKSLRKRLKGDIDIESVKKLLRDLNDGGTKGIVIEGGGEPTLYKYFDEVVKYAYDLGFGVGLITNGSRPLKRDLLDKFEWIRVSLDASNLEEQITLKGADDFERVMSHIKLYCASRATVGVGYVVTKDNIGSLEPLIFRLSNFGVNYVQFRPVIDHPELAVDVDLSYLKRYENNSFSIITDGMSQNIIAGNAGLPCIAHSLTTIVTADGGVYLCGRLNIHHWLEPIGNIYNKSFRDIWFGDKRAEQSEMVLNQEFCKINCPRCRLTKFNRLFYITSKITTRNFI
jgi:spore coat polysaccharide biosynthesis protein SpsF (cytidylyltransferase family)/MoaA/NifB/PqqE/SkfB family radical SAM enzyme